MGGMTAMNMKQILINQKSDVALVIGNGINRYAQPDGENSWYELLVGLGKQHFPPKFSSVPAGISLTEFYDLAELKSTGSATDSTLQQDFCECMKSWLPCDQHRRIVEWAQKWGRPILTTNFDELLSGAGGCKRFKTKKDGFTDFYPWETYYGIKKIDDPSKEFGIWHVNGMRHYHRSIRLGLTHYMGSVARARALLHGKKGKTLFSGKSRAGWDGAASWLYIVFSCPLLIFGLALEENEVFLRWLLIERARYFRKYPDLKKSAWYVYTDREDQDKPGEQGSSEKKQPKPGKEYFLEGVGVTPIQIGSYDDIYSNETWN
jgi:hypothetical protein